MLCSIDKTNASKEMTLEMLKMLKVKSNIKVFVVEKTKIKEEDAKELAGKMKLETSHNQKRQNVNISKKKTVELLR